MAGIPGLEPTGRDAGPAGMRLRKHDRAEIVQDLGEARVVWNVQQIAAIRDIAVRFAFLVDLAIPVVVDPVGGEILPVRPVQVTGVEGDLPRPRFDREGKTRLRGGSGAQTPAVALEAAVPVDVDGIVSGRKEPVAPASSTSVAVVVTPSGRAIGRPRVPVPAEGFAKRVRRRPDPRLRASPRASAPNPGPS